MTILVVDVGTSSVRAGVVRPDATVAHVHRRPLPPSSPAPGLVEFDAGAMAEAALDVATAVLDEAGAVEAVGVANQRASAVVWDAATGRPVGPGLGWQDLRTVGTCLELAAEGMRFAPNETATKVAWLLDNAAGPSGRERDGGPSGRERMAARAAGSGTDGPTTCAGARSTPGSSGT